MCKRCCAGKVPVICAARVAFFRACGMVLVCGDGAAVGCAMCGDAGLAVLDVAAVVFGGVSGLVLGWLVVDAWCWAWAWLCGGDHE